MLKLREDAGGRPCIHTQMSEKYVQLLIKLRMYDPYNKKTDIYLNVSVRSNH